MDVRPLRIKYELLYLSDLKQFVTWKFTYSHTKIIFNLMIILMYIYILTVVILIVGNMFWNIVAINFMCIPSPEKLFNTISGAFLKARSITYCLRSADITSRARVYCRNIKYNKVTDIDNISFIIINHLNVAYAISLLCVCVYLLVCLLACRRACLLACLLACLCACVRACVRVRVFVCLFVC